MSDDRHSVPISSAADLAEDVELPPELKTRILALHARLDDSTHWELLGVPWNAPVPAVRAAYLELARVYHPDRHTGRRLGSYLPRIERIFRVLTDARDELCDEERRALYVRKTAPPEEFARIEARRIQDEGRAGERRARLARSNPLVARATRVQELVDHGKRALAEGRFAQAVNDFTTAAGIDPRHAEAHALAEEARRQAGSERVRVLHDEAHAAAAVGHLTEALALLRDALKADPGALRCATAAAGIALRGGKVAEALQFAEQAVRAAPEDAQALELLASAHHAAGDDREARRVARRALELHPERGTTRELMKKLRWSPFR